MRSRSAAFPIRKKATCCTAILGYPLPFTIEFLLETQIYEQEGKGSHGKP